MLRGNFRKFALEDGKLDTHKSEESNVIPPLIVSSLPSSGYNLFVDLDLEESSMKLADV